MFAQILVGQSAVWGASPAVAVRSFLADPAICRAGRPVPLTAVIVNDGTADAEVTATLRLPRGVRLVSTSPPAPIRISATDGEHRLQFVIEAEEDGPQDIVLELKDPGVPVVTHSLTVTFLPARPFEKLDAVPPPQPVATDILVGAIHCPLWEEKQVDLWRGVLRHPERLPALGLYSQEHPQVAEWEAKWALEHGISFFVYCWYRDGQGGAVRTRFGRGLHDGLFRSRVADTMPFAILWENQAQGVGGVADERDLLDNVVPYWIETFFKRPNYLTIDKKPVLFIYEMESFIRDLGGVQPAVRAIEAMRAACRAAGFGGLTVIGEYRGFVPATLDRMRDLGVDASFAYCWHLPGSPDPDAAVAGQLAAIRAVRDRGVLPQVVTVSQGWSGWHDEGTVWSVPPDRFERLLREAKAIVAASPRDSLAGRMILLDNWNEWSEGHFIAPSRRYGFGYLDAVHNVFAKAPSARVDLLPEDVGLGPYDAAARAALARREELRPLRTRRVTAAPPPADLVGWWTFDEPSDTPVAYDASGHRLGGELVDVRRVEGLEGGAIACDGGVVVVPDSPLLSVSEALSIDCWVRTDVAGQHNRWIVNRVHGGGESTGYRLGLLHGKPCFEVPQAAWSHHLTAADPLPLGRWVHLAGTFDGRVMRLYVDGDEVAALDRPGSVNRNHFDLVIGGYAPGSEANFQGTLDEVRLFSRILSPDEIHAHSR
ncbi:MAG: LamG-like jellyroll fold domain-containing protein [Pirellulales bacterium]